MEYIDLKAQYKHLKSDIDANIQQVIDSADFINGSMVTQFEEKLAEFIGVKHVVACSDGTAALQLIYMAYGIGSGDAVFCPDMTFIASIEPAVLLGATPVFCEIDKKTYNISAASLERQVRAVLQEGTLKPRAVVAVDFVGNPADYEEVRKVTDKYHLLLIEDAAQGVGASYHEKRCGSLGDIGATSFFPSKPLGCYGDGGAVFTNDDDVASVIRSYHMHGKGKDKYDNVRIGLNARLDTIQAAVLLPKLDILPMEMEKRQKIAHNYEDGLSGYVITPYVAENCISAYAQYVVCAKSSEERNSIRTALRENEIPTILYYPTPMHKLPVFQETQQYGEKFFYTEEYSEYAFGIPFSPYLSEEDQNLVINTIIKTVGEK